MSKENQRDEATSARSPSSRTLQPNEACPGSLHAGLPNDNVTLFVDRANLLQVVEAHAESWGRRLLPTSVVLAQWPMTDSPYYGVALDAAMRIIRSKMRLDDVIVRYDETRILMLLPTCGELATSSILKRFNATLAQHPQLGLTTLGVQLSFGVCVLQPGNGLPAESILETAEAALRSSLGGSEHATFVQANALPTNSIISGQ